MSENEILDEFGAPEPSKRRPWGLVLPVQVDPFVHGTAIEWRATAWFRTRRACEAYGLKHHRREGYAVARIGFLSGCPL